LIFTAVVIVVHVIVAIEFGFEGKDAPAGPLQRFAEDGHFVCHTLESRLVVSIFRKCSIECCMPLRFYTQQVKHFMAKTFIFIHLIYKNKI
jgi:hypothetical protein